MEGRKDAIVAFYADGSEKYTSMTTYALVSFLRATPVIPAALFTHNHEVQQRVLSEVPEAHRHRVAARIVSPQPPLPNWNPTQYKLEIASLQELGFETIFWFDSDIIVYGDMTEFIMEFVRSSAQVYLVADHVMHDERFLARWREKHPDTVIPQACLMGFRSSIIRPLFERWKAVWTDWISPWPFSKYSDPRPDFKGSSFCIEQYALGQALQEFFAAVHKNSQSAKPFQLLDYVLLFERDTLLIDGNGNTVATASPGSRSSTAGQSRWPFTRADDAISEAHGSDRRRPNGVALFSSSSAQWSAPVSFELSSASFEIGSWFGAQVSDTASFDVRGLSVNLAEFSGGFVTSSAGGSINLAEFSGVFPGGSVDLSQFSGGSINLAEFSGSVDLRSLAARGSVDVSSLSLDTSSFSGPVSIDWPAGAFIVDRFGHSVERENGSIFHTYSQFYPRAKEWFEKQERH